MITERKIKKAKKLLALWTPQRLSEKTYYSLHDIAKMTGLSYSTVFKIKEGRYDKIAVTQKQKSSYIFNVNKFKNWLTGNAV